MNSGFPGIYVLRVEGGAGSATAIEVPLTVHAGQDVRIVAMGEGTLASTTFESSLTVQESGMLAFVNGFENVTFDAGVNADGTAPFQGPSRR